MPSTRWIVTMARTWMGATCASHWLVMTDPLMNGAEKGVEDEVVVGVDVDQGWLIH